MQELITRLTEKAGISADQAGKAIDTIKDFVKEKFPMMAGAVDNLFAAAPETIAAATPVAIPVATAIVDPAAPAANTTLLDKISDVIPGATGQKVEDFAKGAALKAEEVFDSLKDKVSDMFGSDKK